MDLFTGLGLRTRICCGLLLMLFSVGCGQEDTPCECVPYFLCQGPNGTITIDGTDLIDIKFGIRTRAGTRCADPIATCCNVPAEFRTTTTSTPPPLPETSPVDIVGTTTTTTTAIPPIPPTVVVPSRLCGVRRELPTASRILNTNGVSTGATYYAEFPWMMAILVEDGRQNGTVNHQFKCGGSLIHPSVVVTAAHCIVGLNQGLVNIRGGEWDPQSLAEPLPHQDRRVASVLVHPGFNPRNLHNDIAVIIVDRPYNTTDNVDMICLPPSPEFSNFDNSRCVAAGWGTQSFTGNSETQEILRKVDLPIVPRAECQSRLQKTKLGSYFQLHSSFTCAGGEIGADTCRGDGGGPLFCPLPQDNSRWAQVGITAGGVGCGEGFPGLYTNVVNYVTWIIEQLPSGSATDGNVFDNVPDIK